MAGHAAVPLTRPSTSAPTAHARSGMKQRRGTRARRGRSPHGARRVPRASVGAAHGAPGAARPATSRPPDGFGVVVSAGASSPATMAARQSGGCLVDGAREAGAYNPTAPAVAPPRAPTHRGRRAPAPASCPKKQMPARPLLCTIQRRRRRAASAHPRAGASPTRP
eukprot:TRINITY_DN7774_c0_g1_i1.p1 TRINITY_DN7774_c0_g1~~TRINITY_DN7774_c0_g1_i1.p1  ORF type:complete len:166 (+),score=4.85 TRINITY_DN7774_c0_g1_i1:521-1018(+)